MTDTADAAELVRALRSVLRRHGLDEHADMLDAVERGAVLAPAATPGEIVSKLNAEMVRIIQSPDFRKRMEEIGAEPVADTPAQMAQRIRDDTARYANLVKEAKVAID